MLQGRCSKDDSSHAVDLARIKGEPVSRAQSSRTPAHSRPRVPRRPCLSSVLGCPESADASGLKHDGSHVVDHANIESEPVSRA